MLHRYQTVMYYINKSILLKRLLMFGSPTLGVRFRTK